jgi:hypothetical protein
VPVPRSKKPPGEAADPRNGQQLVLAAGEPLAKFGLPKRADKKPYDLRTRRMWAAYWADERLSSVALAADRELLIRWAQAADDAIKAHALAWDAPISKGSMGQEVPSPYFAIAGQALAEVEKCERQLGIGALNRSRLGYAVVAEKRSLLDLAAAYPGRDGGGDPREG